MAVSEYNSSYLRDSTVLITSLFCYIKSSSDNAFETPGSMVKNAITGHRKSTSNEVYLLFLDPSIDCYNTEHHKPKQRWIARKHSEPRKTVACIQRQLRSCFRNS